MKKQGSFYLKLISILLGVFMLVYIVGSALSKDGVPHTIEPALYCEVGDGETVSGFVVRGEKVLTSDAPIVVCDLTEGQRVGGGQSVATGYDNDSARQSREMLFSLQRQREQLALAELETDGKNNDVLDTQISHLIVSISGKTADQRLDAARTFTGELKPLVLRRSVSGDDEKELKDRISRIDERIALLTTQSATGATPITVEEPGYFSMAVDGYESLLTPEILETMSLIDLHSVAEEHRQTPENAIGRLITGQKWYYAAEIPSERREQCHEGSRLTVKFAGQGLQNLKMKIERVGEDEDGHCILILSCKEQMQRVTTLRSQTAEIIFDSFEGLRIPKKALYYKEGVAGVYVLEAGRAEWKTVDKLLEYGDYYLLEWDSSSTDNLWPNDQIIITDKNIRDGTVIVK